MSKRQHVLAHRIIESIHTIKDTMSEYPLHFGVTDDSYYLDGIIDWVNDAQKFKFDDCFLPENGEVSHQSWVPLPYDKCYYEIHFKNSFPIILLLKNATDENNAIDVEWCEYSEAGNGIIEPQGYLMRFVDTKDGIKTQCAASSNVTKHHDLYSESELREMLLTTAATVFFINSFLACSNIKKRVIPAPKFLNKSRKKKKKPLMFEYYTLILNIERVEYEKDPDAEPSGRQSPRIHFRRGHIRTYETGLRIWIQPMVVGNKKNGVIHKDYKVK